MIWNRQTIHKRNERGNSKIWERKEQVESKGRKGERVRGRA